MKPLEFKNTNKNFQGTVRTPKTLELQKIRGLFQPEENSEYCLILRLSPTEMIDYSVILVDSQARWSSRIALAAPRPTNTSKQF